MFSERCPPQPLPPQVLQQGGERQGGGLDGGRGGVLQEKAPEELWGQQVSEDGKTFEVLILKVEEILGMSVGMILKRSKRKYEDDKMIVYLYNDN